MSRIRAFFVGCNVLIIISVKNGIKKIMASPFK